MKNITQLQIVLKLTMSGTIPQPPPYVLMACRGTTLPLPHTWLYQNGMVTNTLI